MLSNRLFQKQWFLKVEDISKRAMKVVEEGQIKFYPKSWEKPYLLWLENPQGTVALAGRYGGAQDSCLLLQGRRKQV